MGDYARIRASHIWEGHQRPQVDMANPNGWVWSGLKVADAVAPELLGQSYKLTKKGVDVVYKEWKTREGMVKENDQDIRIESTNTSINSSQNHGSVGEERQGCPDGEGLQAPERCFRDAAGATKEQTPSDLASDNGLVGRHVKEIDQTFELKAQTHRSILVGIIWKRG
ncbi:hypothetical protein QJS10_CPB21g00730 [Acorus calamus]|uniref:Uncharacterized protein n=1 Tax=Acorus calamus TaxID=4465 RepID=A0AAV9C7P0_ACOCL|nr:hypothetical protein QJS10_CPB21g00730 [Acorus calamus]